MTVQESGPYLVRVTRRCEPCRGTGFVLAAPTYEGDGCEDCGGTGTSHPFDEGPLTPGSGERVVSVVAVATLDEAIRRARAEISRNWPADRPWEDAAPLLVEVAEVTGRPIAVDLPDGSSITVEQTTWREIAILGTTLPDGWRLIDPYALARRIAREVAR